MDNYHQEYLDKVREYSKEFHSFLLNNNILFTISDGPEGEQGLPVCKYI
jgi:hypothetical protein